MKERHIKKNRFIFSDWATVWADGTWVKGASCNWPMILVGWSLGFCQPSDFKGIRTNAEKFEHVYSSVLGASVKIDSRDSETPRI